MLLIRSELKKQENISAFFSSVFFLYSETQQIFFIPVLEYFLFIFKSPGTEISAHGHDRDFFNDRTMSG